MNQLIFWDITRNDTNTAADPSPTNGAYVWINLGSVEKPAETMFTGDTGIAGRYEPLYFGNGFNETYGFLALHSSGRPQWSRPWRYGKDSANYSWLDGHATSMKGDRIYPNPNKTQAVGSWPLAARQRLYCAAAKYQAATAADREYLASQGGPGCTQ